MDTNSLHWKLDDSYSIRSMPSEEFDPLYKKYSAEVFVEDTQIFRLGASLSDAEHEKLDLLRERAGDPLYLRLGVFKGETFAGWHLGSQESFSTFYMQNSAILPEHRRRGLYGALVDKVLATATELGFQYIYSRHNSTNNAVIIPKLKRGFVITSLEVSDLFGTLVHLSYYPKALRRKVLDYRVGQTEPDQEIKNLLGI